MKTRLRELRGSLGLEDFTRNCGLTSKSTLTRWERGESEPKASDLTKIGKACGVSVDWLLGLTKLKTLSEHSAAGQGSKNYQPPDIFCKSCIEKGEVIKNLSKALAQGRANAAPTSGACGGAKHAAPDGRERRAGA